MEKYVIIREIGNGSSGSISLVRNTENSKLYAMKKSNLSYFRSISKSTDDIFELATREAKMLKSMVNPNVLEYVEYFIEGNSLCTIIEYIQPGDLSNLEAFFKDSNSYRYVLLFIISVIPENMIISIFLDCLHGLSCIHSHNIVHRDIKPENLFLCIDGRVKIGDFSVSKEYTDTLCRQTCIGTLLYMPPEVIRGKHYDLSADIWSLGCVIYELIWRAPLFNKSSYSELVTEITETWDPVTITFPPLYSEALCKLLTEMLAVRKEDRPSVNDILQNSIFDKLDNGLNYVKYYAERIYFQNEIQNIVRSKHMIIENTDINRLKKNWNDAEFAVKNHKALYQVYSELLSTKH